jgi:hypothetical protein
MIQIRRLGIDQSWVTNMADSRPWARNPKINFRRWTSPAARQSHASAASDRDSESAFIWVVPPLILPNTSGMTSSGFGAGWLSPNGVVPGFFGGATHRGVPVLPAYSITMPMPFMRSSFFGVPKVQTAGFFISITASMRSAVPNSSTSTNFGRAPDYRSPIESRTTPWSYDQLGHMINSTVVRNVPVFRSLEVMFVSEPVGFRGLGGSETPRCGGTSGLGVRLPGVTHA